MGCRQILLEHFRMSLFYYPYLVSINAINDPVQNMNVTDIPFRVELELLLGCPA